MIIEPTPTTNFGWDSDLDEESINNTLIVGAPSSGGAAFIYKEVFENTWTRFDILSPTDGGEFGYSVKVLLLYILLQGEFALSNRNMRVL